MKKETEEEKTMLLAGKTDALQQIRDQIEDETLAKENELRSPLKLILSYKLKCN